MITSLETRELSALRFFFFFFFFFFFCFSMWAIFHCLLVFALGVTGKQCSIIVALSGHILYYFSLNRLTDITCFPLRKHAYLNILKNLPPQNENCQIKNSDILHISARNIGRGYSLEPQSTCLSRNKKK